MSQQKYDVLIVDDSDELRENMADIFQLRGYNTYLAGDGQQALEWVKKRKFDFILMDIKMPIMNGLEAFEAIKRLQPDIPVIIMTAFAVESVITETLHNGAFRMLKKPVDYDEVFTLIETSPHKRPANLQT